MKLTDFPETTTGDDKGVVQGNEGALASNTIAKSRVVGAPDELRPVTVDDGGPSLDKRVFDAIKEGGVGIEIRKSDSFQFETLAGKVRIDELLYLTIGRVGCVDGCEICENLAGRFARRFVDKGLLVRVQVSNVDGLKELSHGKSTRFKLSDYATSRGTHRSGAEDLARTPWLVGWEGYLGG